MDYYKNIDYLERETVYSASGIQYSIVEDLVVEPIGVPFFNEHARIDFDTDDNLCEYYISAARKVLEGWSQLSFGERTMGLTALTLPKNYRLMFGKVDTVTTTGFTNVGDILKEGGSDIDLEYTTLNWIGDDVRVAIARYAAGLYINRENITDTKFSGQLLQDEAKQMISHLRNITLF